MAVSDHASLRDTPFVVTCHDPLKHSRHRLIDLRETPQFLLNRNLTMADAVIVHSPTLKRVVETEFGHLLEGKPVFVVPHGVLSRYGVGEASAVPKRANVLLFGRVEAYKGVEYLIQAEPLIREALPEVRIVVAGPCPERARYEGQVSPGQHIDLRLQRQSDEEVAELFAWADVLALPYTDASQSAVLMHGFAYGLPSVVTRVGGLPDVIDDGDNGLLVPPRDPRALADGIVRLLSDVELRRKIIANVVTGRETTYHWDPIARQTLRVYESLLQSSHP